MPFHPEALTRPALKSLAKALQKAAPEVLGIPVAQHQAQELLARQLGYAHWHEAYAKAGQMAAQSPRPARPTPRPELVEDGPGLTFNRLVEEAKALYGFDLQMTRTLATGLYCDGLISYPMTRSGHLPPHLQADIPDVLATIARLRPQDQARLDTVQANPDAPVWQADQASHHDFYAIIPRALTEAVSLDHEDAQLYGLIVNAYLNLVTRPHPGAVLPLPGLTPNPSWEQYRQVKNLQNKPGMYLDLSLPPLLAVLDHWLGEVALRALGGTPTRLRVSLSARGHLELSSDGRDLSEQLVAILGETDPSLKRAQSSGQAADLISLGLRSQPGWTMAATFLPQVTLSFPLQDRFHDLTLERGEWLTCVPGARVAAQPDRAPSESGANLNQSLAGVRLSAQLGHEPPPNWAEHRPWVSPTIVDQLQGFLEVYTTVAPSLAITFQDPSGKTFHFHRSSGSFLSETWSPMWHAWSYRPSAARPLDVFIQAAVERNDQPLLARWNHGAYGRVRDSLEAH